jgi:hypothetical protein
LERTACGDTFVASRGAPGLKCPQGRFATGLREADFFKNPYSYRKKVNGWNVVARKSNRCALSCFQKRERTRRFVIRVKNRWETNAYFIFGKENNRQGDCGTPRFFVRVLPEYDASKFKLYALQGQLPGGRIFRTYSSLR